MLTLVVLFTRSFFLCDVSVFAPTPIPPFLFPPPMRSAAISPPPDLCPVRLLLPLLQRLLGLRDEALLLLVLLLLLLQVLLLAQQDLLLLEEQLLLLLLLQHLQQLLSALLLDALLGLLLLRANHHRAASRCCCRRRRSCRRSLSWRDRLGGCPRGTCEEGCKHGVGGDRGGGRVWGGSCRTQLHLGHGGERNPHARGSGSGSGCSSSCVRSNGSCRRGDRRGHRSLGGRRDCGRGDDRSEWRGSDDGSGGGGSRSSCGRGGGRGGCGGDAEHVTQVARGLARRGNGTPAWRNHRKWYAVQVSEGMAHTGGKRNRRGGGGGGGGSGSGSGSLSQGQRRACVAYQHHANER